MMWGTQLGTPGCRTFSATVLRALLRGSASRYPGADEATTGAIGWWPEERAGSPEPGQNPPFALPTFKKRKKTPQVQFGLHKRRA